jgi:hypothetical protein
MKRVLLCVALLCWWGLSAAAVYKWTDAQGKVMYGDRPPDGVKAELITLLGNHSPAPSASRQAEPSRVSRTVTATSAKPPVKDEAKKAVEADVATAKAKQCSDAQERYRKLIEGRHIYKEGAGGERKYLSSEEIDAERLNAKQELDSICNNTT